MKRLQVYLIVFIGLFSVVNLSAQSDKQKQLEQRRQAILQEIKQINSLLFQTKKEEKSVLSQVEDINHRISATENLIRITNQQANLLTRNINNNMNRISSLREELEIMKADYAEMVRKSYKSKNQQSRIMFLLSSESFLQAYKRVQYMKQYAAFRKKQGVEIGNKTQELQELNNELLAQKKDKQKLIDENTAAKNQLIKEKKAQEALMATLRKDESKYTTQIRQKQKEADKIDKEIDKLIKAAIAEANRKKEKESKSVSTPTTSGELKLTQEKKALAPNLSKNKESYHGPWKKEWWSRVLELIAIPNFLT